MSADFDKIREIFLAALEQAPDQWNAYLDRICAGDGELRRNVALMLRAHAAGEGPLDRGAVRDEQTRAYEQTTESVGTAIGPYKLLEQIGEGGMGTVWTAQQTEPVKRVVALKLIKAGMDSKQVIARFEAERQALALMDHPNIAKVFDGGMTNRNPHTPREAAHRAERDDYAGRPFFVMDLVKGMPITRYCDEHHLTPRQRLELFVPVCHAIQHAHQKGIIHRDLKPSNVLVALYDGKPVPKVIDFGVAKATGQLLTDKTLVTGFGNIVGTLEYMSPEQAEINQLDIDTRSDIYSLGVLLYELLTGSPPFRGKELEKAGMLEMLRLIREQEPSKPSTKLSTAEGLPTLAANRGTEPAKLTKLVRGELDWIVMKALEKDRSRRYETANGFALDLQRYLADEPVSAGPPSVRYRLRKFMRRNRGPVLATALVVLALVGGIVGTSLGLLEARRQAVAAEQAAQRERDANYAVQENARQAQENATKAEQNAAVAREQSTLALQTLQSVIFDLQRGLENVPGAGQVRQRLLNTAIEQLKQVSTKFINQAAIDSNSAAAMSDLGYVLLQIGTEGLSVSRRSLGDRPSDRSAESMGQTATQVARDLYQRAFEISSELAANNPTDRQAQRDLITAYYNLGDVNVQTGRVSEAMGCYQHGLEIAKKGAETNPADAQAQRDLSIMYFKLGDVSMQTGQVAEAIAFYLNDLKICQTRAASDPNDVKAQRDLSTAIERLGVTYERLGQTTQALEQYERMLAIKKTLAERNLSDALAKRELAMAHMHVGDVNLQSGQVPSAIANYQAALEITKKLTLADPNDVSGQRDLWLAYMKLGDVSRRSRQVAEALKCYHDALKISERRAAADPNDAQAQRDLSGSYQRLGTASLQAGQLTEALEYCKKDLELSLQLAAADPTDAQAQRDLSVSYETLGNVRVQNGQLADAIEYYQKALPICQKLAAADPTDAFAQRDLAMSYRRIAAAQQQQRQYEPAIDSYSTGLKLLQQLKDQQQLAPTDEKWIGAVEQAIAICQSSARAIEDLDFALAQPPALAADLLAIRANVLAERGRHADAAVTAEKLRGLAPNQPDNLYNVACCYALCAASVANASPEHSAERQSIRDHYADETIAALRQAVAAGFKDFDHMQRDPDLAAVRERPEFAELLDKKAK